MCNLSLETVFWTAFIRVNFLTKTRVRQSADCTKRRIFRVVPYGDHPILFPEASLVKE